MQVFDIKDIELVVTTKIDDTTKYVVTRTTN